MQHVGRKYYRRSYSPVHELCFNQQHISISDFCGSLFAPRLPLPRCSSVPPFTQRPVHVAGVSPLRLVQRTTAPKIGRRPPVIYDDWAKLITGWSRSMPGLRIRRLRGRLLCATDVSSAVLEKITSCSPLARNFLAAVGLAEITIVNRERLRRAV